MRVFSSIQSPKQLLRSLSNLVLISSSSPVTDYLYYLLLLGLQSLRVHLSFPCPRHQYTIVRSTEAAFYCESRNTLIMNTVFDLSIYDRRYSFLRSALHHRNQRWWMLFFSGLLKIPLSLAQKLMVDYWFEFHTIYYSRIVYNTRKNPLEPSVRFRLMLYKRYQPNEAYRN